MRNLIDMATFIGAKDHEMDEVTLPNGDTITLSPPFPVKQNETYRVQLWGDGTASMWQLVADGKAEKKMVQ